jgi:HAD superfamily hydrolase (TIGR01450 family)
MNSVAVLVFDSDGVLSSGGRALPYALELIQELNENHFPFYILTNNPFLDAEKKSPSYRKQGFQIAPEKIIGAAHPLKNQLENLPRKYGKLYAVGSEDPTEMLRNCGYEIDLCSDEIDGILLLDDDLRWDADRMARLLELLMHQPQLPFIVPNPDLVYPDRPGHLYLTTGSWSRMLVMLCKEKGLNIEPIYLGKPYSPIYKSLQNILDVTYPELNKKNVLMLGDSPATDILGANRQGWLSALIETGNHRFGRDRSDSQAHWTFKDLGEFWKVFKNGRTYEFLGHADRTQKTAWN